MEKMINKYTHEIMNHYNKKTLTLLLLKTMLENITIKSVNEYLERKERLGK